MRGQWRSAVGVLGCLASMGCHCGEPAVKPTPESEPAPAPAPAPKQAAAPAPAPAPAPAKAAPGSPSGMMVGVQGAVGGKDFNFTCTGPGSSVDAGSGAGTTTLAESAGHTIITCRDPKTGFVLTLDIVDPKLGRLDASPNQGASVITFNAGPAGTADTHDGGSSANLNLTAWDQPGGHRAGNFNMNWYDNADLKLKEGRVQGVFAM